MVSDVSSGRGVSHSITKISEISSPELSSPGGVGDLAEYAATRFRRALHMLFRAFCSIVESVGKGRSDIGITPKVKAHHMRGPIWLIFNSNACLSLSHIRGQGRDSGRKVSK